MEMGQEDLLALTENVINEYLQEGSIEGLSLLMDPDIVAYSHLNVNYVRGDWNVRQFLNRKYERLSPFSLNRCKMRCTMTGEGASIVARHLFCLICLDPCVIIQYSIYIKNVFPISTLGVMHTCLYILFS